MNQLTVIQNIVTPELVAERINVKNLGAALVTAGALQTDEAANRGVKITSAGISAWDTTGRQTIRLDGSNNLITGSFQTSDDTVGRIRLFNQQHPVTKVQSGYLTFHGSGGTQSSQGVVEYTGDQISLSVRAGSEGGHTAPFRSGLNITSDGATLAGKLHMAGQFSKASTGLTARSLQFGHIPAGGAKESTITFYKVNNQSPYHFVQLSSSNFARLSSVSWTTDNSIKIRVHNLGTTQADNVWVDVLLIAAER